jgi:hypothetical protein
MITITKNTVNVDASQGQFEEHPESYNPRVFIGPMGDFVYELLSNGQAILWLGFPQKGLCGFDFWTIYVNSVHDIFMNRHNRPDLHAIINSGSSASSGFTPLNVPYAGVRKAVNQADGYSGSDSSSDSDSGVLLTDHLPEGSH